jgi:hypothetical protein
MAWPSADVMPVRSGGMVNTQINDVPGYYVPEMLNPNSRKVNLMPLSARGRGAASLLVRSSISSR